MNLNCLALAAGRVHAGNQPLPLKLLVHNNLLVWLSSWENSTFRGDFFKWTWKNSCQGGGKLGICPGSTAQLLPALPGLWPGRCWCRGMQLSSCRTCLLVQLLLPAPVGARCGPSHLEKGKLEQQLHGPKQPFRLLQVDRWICWLILLFQRMPLQ